MFQYQLPVKAVNQSHWSKPFDTVWLLERQKGLVVFGHVNSLKTTIELQKKNPSTFPKELIQVDLKMYE